DGIQEGLLTSGCPGTEAKCISCVKECWGQLMVDCGGREISEHLDSVKMSCICISPENRFKYVWEMLIPNKAALIVSNDSAIMEACKGTHLVTFQYETPENGSIIASVKHPVNTTDAIQVFFLVTGIIVVVDVMFDMIF
ncbi:PREDICTED: sperm acrosome membrane-associated protein 1, partial [Buceros rhinoceros silvestris]|uniref:sperm acrosome membrane-associated protein 1 n=1 Tax=Buceros rhinoceros silvestris TaxID=175836 RepID=UPI0005290978